MEPLPYRFEETPGYTRYKVSSQLRDHLAWLMQDPANREYIEQLLNQLTNYSQQLSHLGKINGVTAVQDVYNAIDKFFQQIPEEQKKDIRCSTGCTHCCYIDLEVSELEVSCITDYCRENAIAVDQDYLALQAAAGRKNYSGLSRCVFLQDNLCSIYPVRPVACRKHWVTSDPVCCDTSQEAGGQVAAIFEINTEVLASALLHTADTGPLEVMLLSALQQAP